MDGIKHCSETGGVGNRCEMSLADALLHAPTTRRQNSNLHGQRMNVCASRFPSLALVDMDTCREQ